MTDDPMFIWFKGRGKRRLVPASRRGWMVFALFMVTIMAPGATLGLVAERWPWAVWVFLGFALAALALFFRFAISRAKVIDLDEVVRDWDEFRAWRDKGRPR